MTPATSPAAHRHTLAEDIHAMLIGSSFIAVGLAMLKTAGLVTGGVAGIALIISYLTQLPVGPLFFVLNLPFYVLAQRALGWAFAIKTLATNAMLALMTLFMPKVMTFESLDPIFAAVFGGTILGMGVLALARHRSSVGGIGVLALYMQERRGKSAGKVQVISDLAIIACAAIAVPWDKLLLSVVSAIALSLVIIANHRPGRYAGY